MMHTQKDTQVTKKRNWTVSMVFQYTFTPAPIGPSPQGFSLGRAYVRAVEQAPGLERALEDHPDLFKKPTRGVFNNGLIYGLPSGQQTVDVPLEVGPYGSSTLTLEGQGPSTAPLVVTACTLRTQWKTKPKPLIWH